MNVLCVIPARGGSKNAPLQNSRLLAGKPLLAYTAEAALAAASLSKVVLSTDDEAVAETGRRCGLDPWMLPAGSPGELLGVVQDAVRRLEEKGERCDAVCILDPASPFRRAEDIDRCIALLERSGADNVVTVVPVPREYHPQKVYLEGPDGTLEAAPANGSGELPPAFQHDGSVRVVRRDALMNGKGLAGGRTAGYVVDPVRFVKLERPEDWGRAERIARLGTHKGTAGRIAPLAGTRRNHPVGWAPTAIAEPLVSTGVGLAAKGALGSSGTLKGTYLDPVRKAAKPRSREVETPFPIQDARLPAEREVTAHEVLDPVSPALLAPRSRTGSTPTVQRIEDPFRPQAEVTPDIGKAERPLVAALAARNLAGSALQKAAEPKWREIAGGSQARAAAAPIEFSGLPGKAAGRVKPVQPFALGVSALGPAPKGQPRIRPWPPVVLAAAFFPDPQALEPASGRLKACEQLVYAPVFRRDGRQVAQVARATVARVEAVGTHAAELLDARPLVFAHPLAGAPTAAIKGRARMLASKWVAEDWERLAQESTVVVFRLLQAKARGVKWPVALVFVPQPKRPPKAGSQTAMDPYGLTVFAVPVAGVPKSRDVRTRLRGAEQRKIAAPAVRPDKKTAASAGPCAAGFHDLPGEPRTPAFRGVVRAAMMPAGVFHLIEIDDHEDDRTWKRAPHYQGLPAILDPGRSVLASLQVAAPAGYHRVFTEPRMGQKGDYQSCGPFVPAFTVVLANGEVAPMRMDFAAIAPSGSSRWRLPFKKTGMF